MSGCELARRSAPEIECEPQGGERGFPHLIPLHHIRGELRVLLQVLRFVVPVEGLLDVCEYRIGAQGKRRKRSS